MLKSLKTRRFWFTLVRDGVILVIVFYAVHLYQTRNMPDKMPELNAQLITGETVHVREMYQQAPVLIYFWGSWCPVCSFTSETVSELSKDYQVLSVALSSGNRQQVQNYLHKNEYAFPVINDQDGAISQKWGVMATPGFFIINTDGEISSVTTGITSAWGLKFRLWLAS